MIRSFEVLRGERWGREDRRPPPVAFAKGFAFMSGCFRKLTLCLGMLFYPVFGNAAPTTPSGMTAIQLNNLGVAYMNQQNMPKAEQIFAQAFRKDPTLLTTQLNQCIALLNM
jgi:hypothetical protein